MNKKLLSFSVALSTLMSTGLLTNSTKAMQTNPPAYEITPWKVSGVVDYDNVLEKFGVEPLNDELISRWEHLMKRANKGLELHSWIRRGIFFFS